MELVGRARMPWRICNNLVPYRSLFAEEISLNGKTMEVRPSLKPKRLDLGCYSKGCVAPDRPKRQLGLKVVTSSALLPFRLGACREGVEFAHSEIRSG